MLTVKINFMRALVCSDVKLINVRTTDSIVNGAF
jgi:hypothetical protein